MKPPTCDSCGRIMKLVRVPEIDDVVWAHEDGKVACP